jgi:hypothetical protein
MGSLVEFCRAAASANIREWTRQNKENIGMAGRIEKSLLIAIAFAALAPPAKVWAAIADFHDMSWLPGVAKTTGEGGNEPDVATRQLTLDGGATISKASTNMTRGR